MDESANASEATRDASNISLLVNALPNVLRNAASAASAVAPVTVFTSNAPPVVEVSDPNVPNLSEKTATAVFLTVPSSRNLFPALPTISKPFLLEPIVASCALAVNRSYCSVAAPAAVPTSVKSSSRAPRLLVSLPVISPMVVIYASSTNSLLISFAKIVKVKNSVVFNVFFKYSSLNALTPSSIVFAYFTFDVL